MKGTLKRIFAGSEFWVALALCLVFYAIAAESMANPVALWDDQTIMNFDWAENGHGILAYPVGKFSFFRPASSLVLLMGSVAGLGIEGQRLASFFIFMALMVVLGQFMALLADLDEAPKDGKRSSKTLAIAFALAIFAFHPAAGHAVLWVSGRGDLFVALIFAYCAKRIVLGKSQKGAAKEFLEWFALAFAMCMFKDAGSFPLLSLMPLLYARCGKKWKAFGGAIFLSLATSVALRGALHSHYLGASLLAAWGGSSPSSYDYELWGMASRFFIILSQNVHALIFPFTESSVYHTYPANDGYWILTGLLIALAFVFHLTVFARSNSKRTPEALLLGFLAFNIQYALLGAVSVSFYDNLAIERYVWISLALLAGSILTSYGSLRIGKGYMAAAAIMLVSFSACSLGIGSATLWSKNEIGFWTRLSENTENKSVYVAGNYLGSLVKAINRQAVEKNSLNEVHAMLRELGSREWNLRNMKKPQKEALLTEFAFNYAYASGYFFGLDYSRSWLGNYLLIEKSQNLLAFMAFLDVQRNDCRMANLNWRRAMETEQKMSLPSNSAIPQIRTAIERRCNAANE